MTTTQIPPVPAADGAAIASARAVRLPGWVIVLALYAGSRLWSTALLAIGIRLAPDEPGIHRPGVVLDGFFDLTGSVWDAWHYREISEHGYPTELPRAANGDVRRNPWAFLPVFAALTRAATALTGADHGVAAVAVATLAGGAASITLFLLLEPRIGRARALWAVAAFVFGPMGFVLQLGYAEGVFLFCFFAGTLAMQRRQYWLMLPFVVVGAFTRPGMLALALGLAVHGVLRLRTEWPSLRDGRHRPSLRRDVVAIVVVGVVSAVAGTAWPVVAGFVTGVPDAYLQTEMAWWRRLVPGVDHFVPLTPWFLLWSTRAGVVGVVAVVVCAAVGAWFLLGRGRRELGPDVVAVSSSYALYLFAVFLPQQSTLRLLMPAAPMLGARLLTGTTTRGMLTVGLGALLQIWAVTELWVLGHP